MPIGKVSNNNSQANAKLPTKLPSIVDAAKNVTANHANRTVAVAPKLQLPKIKPVDWNLVAEIRHDDPHPTSQAYDALPEELPGANFFGGNAMENGKYTIPSTQMNDTFMRLNTKTFKLDEIRVKDDYRIEPELRNKWLCVDLALADLRLRFMNLEGSHSINRARFFTDRVSREILLGSKATNLEFVDLHVRALTQPKFAFPIFDETDGIYEQFKRMPIPNPGEKNRKHFLIATGTHAMSCTLTVSNKHEVPTYSMSLYDPNVTFNHRKFVSTKKEEFIEFSFEKHMQYAKEDLINYDFPGGNIAGDKVPVVFYELTENDFLTFDEARDAIDEASPEQLKELYEEVHPDMYWWQYTCDPD